MMMRLDGESYQAIADKAGISRQRVQQLLSPPSYVRKLVKKRANDKCQKCGLLLGQSGHVHHVGNKEEDYNDVDNLLYLCPSCHRKEHDNLASKKELANKYFTATEARIELGLSRWDFNTRIERGMLPAPTFIDTVMRGSVELKVRYFDENWLRIARSIMDNPVLKRG